VNPRLHVGLNLVFLVPGETGGMEVYARELIAALRHERPELRLTAFINREAAAAGGPWGEDLPAVTVPVNARRRVQWVRGEQQLLPPLARRAGIDLLHSLASTSPAWGPFRRVVTIHDLIYRVHPEAHFGLRTFGMRLLVPLAARRCDRILAVSRATAADLRRLLRVPDEKLDVVPNGLGARPEAPPTPEEEVRRRFALADRPMVLSVSAKRPHKNLPRLLEALALIPRERRPVLVLPGYPTPHEAELRALAARLQIEPDVRFLGWVDAGDLEGLYAAAACFVFPSLYEGFGLPVLEAMSREVPVACSDRSSLPEVAGDAARLFDPERPEAIATAITAILADPAEASRLRTAGRAQAARFSWEATARGTLAAYERAAGGSAPAVPGAAVSRPGGGRAGP
jgi:glycosyltransferase involved in cell wall biosynthesis